MVINKVVYFVVFSNESFLIEYSAMMHRLVLGLLLAPAGAVRLQYSRRVVASGIASGLTLQALKAPVRADGDEIVSTILSAGNTDSPPPQRAQKAVVDYTLWINAFEGKQIDSSKGSAFPPRLPSPFVFSVGVGEVIPGWDRTVRQMHVGEKRRVTIPSSLGYGSKGIGPIPGDATLYFEIELLELKPLPKLTAQQQEWLDSHPEP